MHQVFQYDCYSQIVNTNACTICVLRKPGQGVKYVRTGSVLACACEVCILPNLGTLHRCQGGARFGSVNYCVSSPYNITLRWSDSLSYILEYITSKRTQLQTVFFWFSLFARIVIITSYLIIIIIKRQNIHCLSSTKNGAHGT